MPELVKKAAEVTSVGVQAGEGWLLTAEILEAHRIGLPERDLRAAVRLPAQPCDRPRHVRQDSPPAPGSQHRFHRLRSRRLGGQPAQPHQADDRRRQEGPPRQVRRGRATARRPLHLRRLDLCSGSNRTLRTSFARDVLVRLSAHPAPADSPQGCPLYGSASVRAMLSSQRLRRVAEPETTGRDGRLSVFRIAYCRRSRHARRPARIRHKAMATPRDHVTRTCSTEPNPKHVESLTQVLRDPAAPQRGTGGFGVEIEHLPVHNSDDTAVTYYESRTAWKRCSTASAPYYDEDKEYWENGRFWSDSPAPASAVSLGTRRPGGDVHRHPAQAGRPRTRCTPRSAAKLDPSPRRTRLPTRQLRLPAQIQLTPTCPSTPRTATRR